MLVQVFECLYFLISGAHFMNLNKAETVSSSN